MNRKQIIALLVSMLMIVSAFGVAQAEDAAAKTVVYAASVYTEGQTDRHLHNIQEAIQFFATFALFRIRLPYANSKNNRIEIV